MQVKQSQNLITIEKEKNEPNRNKSGRNNKTDLFGLISFFAQFSRWPISQNGTWLSFTERSKARSKIRNRSIRSIYKKNNFEFEQHLTTWQGAIQSHFSFRKTFIDLRLPFSVFYLSSQNYFRFLIKERKDPERLNICLRMIICAAC